MTTRPKRLCYIPEGLLIIMHTVRCAWWWGGRGVGVKRVKNMCARLMNAVGFYFFFLSIHNIIFFFLWCNLFHENVRSTQNVCVCNLSGRVYVCTYYVLFVFDVNLECFESMRLLVFGDYRKNSVRIVY